MWNLGTEGRTDDLTVTSAGSHHYSTTHNNNKSSNQKSSGDIRPSALHLPQAQPDISLLEAQPDPPAPFTIDTSHYNTSRVVINPGTPTEPTYELEKKGHTSVIRVSYPGPADHQQPAVPHHQQPPQQQPPQQQTVLKSFQPSGGVVLPSLPTSASHHHQSNRDVHHPPKHRSRSPPSSSVGGGSTTTTGQGVVQRVAPPPIRQDSAMGLESFHFVAVLGRGHFGKVRIICKLK